MDHDTRLRAGENSVRMDNIAYVSVGSNLGDSLGHCREGVKRLNSGGNARVRAHSRYFRTKPVGYLEQPWFVNAVFALETALPPFFLLRRLQEIQRLHGRDKSGIRFGPRVLDLDILFYNDIIINAPELVIPHPRITERRFVLEPLCDIAPGLIHPGLGVPVRQLLDALAGGFDGCIPLEVPLPDALVPEVPDTAPDLN